MLIGHLGTNFSEIIIEIHTFSFTKMHLKMSAAKWQPFCLSLHVLMNQCTNTKFNPSYAECILGNLKNTFCIFSIQRRQIDEILVHGRQQPIYYQTSDFGKIDIIRTLFNFCSVTHFAVQLCCCGKSSYRWLLGLICNFGGRAPSHDLMVTQVTATVPGVP